METITFVTGNDGKFNEFQEICQGLGIAVERRDIDLVEIQGNEVDVITAKVKAACEIVGGPVIVEDVSLYIIWLNGFPGPYVKDCLARLGLEKMAKLVCGHDGHAIAHCRFAYMQSPVSKPEIFVGNLHGYIVPPKGDRGMGWDAIFRPDGKDKTLAQMTSAEKNLISHRRHALDKLVDYLKNVAIPNAPKA